MPKKSKQKMIDVDELQKYIDPVHLLFFLGTLLR